MATTIVMACLPTLTSKVEGPGALVLTVERRPSASPPDGAPGVSPLASLDVEGVIVGDERTWDAVRFDRSEHLEAVVAAAAGAEDAFVLTLDPLLDRLLESIETAP